MDAAPRIEYRKSPPLSDAELGALRIAAWGHDGGVSWQPVLARSLAYIGAYRGTELVGFVNVAWDGGAHAFLLDTTVHPNVQRQGVGTELVTRAVQAARERGAEWLHVDYDPHLREFYAGCGFRPTEAGLMRLDGGDGGRMP
ncbi:MAG: GNAT family N-acetyltransferase [Fimbriimonas sp.]